MNKCRNWTGAGYDRFFLRKRINFVVFGERQLPLHSDQRVRDPRGPLLIK
jgi:hypothetical protein